MTTFHLLWLLMYLYHLHNAKNCASIKKGDVELCYRTSGIPDVTKAPSFIGQGLSALQRLKPPDIPYCSWCPSYFVGIAVFRLRRNIRVPNPRYLSCGYARLFIEFLITVLPEFTKQCPLISKNAQSGNIPKYDSYLTEPP